MRSTPASTLLTLLLLLQLPAAAYEEQTAAITVQRLGDRVLQVTTEAGYPNQLAIDSDRGLVVFDTLWSPQVAARFREVIERELGRQDFAYVVSTTARIISNGGQATYPGVPVVAHQSARDAMLARSSGLDQVIQREIGVFRTKAERSRSILEDPPQDPEAAQGHYNWMRFCDRIADDLEQQGYEQTLPEITFREAVALDLGDVTLELIDFGPSRHSNSMLAFLPEEGLLLATAFSPLHLGPLPDRGFNADVVVRWLQVLDELLEGEREIRQVICGFSGSWTRQQLAASRDYIRDLWEGVGVAAAEGLDLEQASQRLSFDGPFSYVKSWPIWQSEGEEWVEQDHGMRLRAFWQAKQNAVLEAAKVGDTSRIARLLDENGALVAQTDDRSCTPLHFAADRGHISAVELLLERGASLTARDVDGDTPLHWAAFAGQREIGALLIERGAPVDARNGQSDTPLHYAARRGHPEMVVLLLEKGADVNAQNHGGETPLTRAALGNHPEAARRLIAAGADTEIRDDYGRTPLLLVARETGDAGMLRLLLDHGAEIDATDRFGDTPLSLTAWRGFAEAIDVLIEKEAAIPTSGEKAEFITIYAAAKGLPRLFSLLAARGADLGLGNDYGGSLLHSAAQGGSTEITGLLLERGLDVNGADRYGWTPLHFAADRGRLEVAEMLLGHGADPDRRTLSGRSALNLAQSGEREPIVQLLRSREVDPSPVRFPVLKGKYFGQEPPGDEPQPFALDIVSSNAGQHGTVSFSPDGREAYWSSSVLADVGYSGNGIMSSHVERGRWVLPRRPSFAPGIEREQGGDVPFVSPDGERMFFLSTRPVEPGGRGGRERIWVAERSAAGWSEPRPLGGAPDSMGVHWQISVARDGALYFASDDGGGHGMGDIYRSAFVDGQYVAPENLGTTINTEHSEGSPYIAPDGSYLLFSRHGQDDGQGAVDLYVSFRNGSAGWSEPRNLGPSLNSEANDICPIVSPDGKYLFFISSRSGRNNIYWVDAGFLDGLRPSG